MNELKYFYITQSYNRPENLVFSGSVYYDTLEEMIEWVEVIHVAPHIYHLYSFDIFTGQVEHLGTLNGGELK